MSSVSRETACLTPKRVPSAAERSKTVVLSQAPKTDVWRGGEGLEAADVRQRNS